MTRHVPTTNQPEEDRASYRRSESMTGSPDDVPGSVPRSASGRQISRQLLAILTVAVCSVRLLELVSAIYWNMFLSKDLAPH